MSWWEEFELVTFPSIPRAGNIYRNNKCVIMSIEDYNLVVEMKKRTIEESLAWDSATSLIEGIEDAERSKMKMIEWAITRLEKIRKENEEWLEK